ncbi:MAG: hypothetical protein WC229_00965 [Candidatus Paceibacterota bacterium]|jgi:hypothetical protein
MEWLDSHKIISSDIDKALIGFNEIQFAIPTFGGSGDDFTTIKPWHYIFFEAEQDLDSSILLLLSAFYKDSFRAIRSFLELQIFALYNFVNKDEVSFQDWFSGKKQTPKIQVLLQALEDKSTAFKRLNEKTKWSEEVKTLYKELSGFMHTQGATYTHTSLRSSNQTVFSEDGIKLGTSLLLKAVRLAGMGFAVNFPMSFQPLPLFDKFAFNQPTGGFLDDGQVNRVKLIFPKNLLSDIAEICLSNEDANALAEGVRSMSDLTENEILDSLKETIENDEFKNSKKEIIKMLSNNEFDKAIAIVLTAQRAVIRAINGILYNPFYEVKKDR